MERRQIPNFANEEEEARYWETHSIAPYIDDHNDIKIEMADDQLAEVRKALKPVTIRLKERQINDAKRIAEIEQENYQTLMRKWINDGIERWKTEHPHETASNITKVADAIEINEPRVMEAMSSGITIDIELVQNLQKSITRLTEILEKRGLKSRLLYKKGLRTTKRIPSKQKETSC